MQTSGMEIYTVLNDKKNKSIVALIVWLWVIGANLTCFVGNQPIWMPVCQLLLWSIILYLEVQDYYDYKTQIDRKQLIRYSLNRGRVFYMLYLSATILFLLYVIGQLYTMCYAIRHEHLKDKMDEDQFASCSYFNVTQLWFQYTVAVFSLLVNAYFFASLTYMLGKIMSLRYSQSELHFKEELLMKQSEDYRGTHRSTIVQTSQQFARTSYLLIQGNLENVVSSQNSLNMQLLAQGNGSGSVEPNNSKDNAYYVESWESYDKGNQNCVICTYEMKGTATIQTQCGHVYHRLCYKKLLENIDQCPLCSFRLQY